MLATVIAACAGAGYAPPGEIDFRRGDEPKPLGYDAGSCRGWLDPALAFPDAETRQIDVVPGAPRHSRCENPLPGHGGEMLSPEPVGVPAWISVRIQVDDLPGTRFAVFLYDDGHEATVELDRLTDGWETSFATFRPDLDPENRRIVAVHESRRPLPSLDPGAWHTVTLHRTEEEIAAYLDGVLLGRATPEDCREWPDCLPEGPLRLRLNAWAPAGWGVDVLERTAVYRVAWARTGTDPRAAFRIVPQSPRVGEDVRFSGRRSGGVGPRVLTSYEWTFGDGAGARGPEATHRYESPGEHRITLVVTDSEGARDTASGVIQVEPTDRTRR